MMPSFTADAAFMPAVDPTPTLYSFQNAGRAEAIAPSFLAVSASTPEACAVDVTLDAIQAPAAPEMAPFSPSTTYPKAAPRAIDSKGSFIFSPKPARTLGLNARPALDPTKYLGGVHLKLDHYGPLRINSCCWILGRQALPMI